MKVNDNISIWGKPPIGAIVEGDGEYHSYPSLINRILQQTGIYIPIANTKGYARLLDRLESYLDNLANTHRPHSIIVTLDARDPIEGGQFSTCVELAQHLRDRIIAWQESRLVANPNETNAIPVSLILQVQKLESWLIADTTGLAKLTEFPDCLADIIWNDVDSQVDDPERWVKDNTIENFNPKRPRTISEAFAKCDVNTIKDRSRSFRKFTKEINICYNYWYSTAIEQDNE